MAERPEDLNLPIAVVSRIIKESIGSNVTVSKEARVAISKAASVFVLYATSCTNSVATRKKRKTMLAEDVLIAMEDMDFPTFVEPLKEALEAFREKKKSKKVEKPKPKVATNGKADKKSTGDEEEVEDEAEANTEMETNDADSADSDVVIIS